MQQQLNISRIPSLSFTSLWEETSKHKYGYLNVSWCTIFNNNVRCLQSQEEATSCIDSQSWAQTLTVIIPIAMAILFLVAGQKYAPGDVHQAAEVELYRILVLDRQSQGVEVLAAKEDSCPPQFGAGLRRSSPSLEDDVPLICGLSVRILLWWLTHDTYDNLK